MRKHKRATIFAALVCAILLFGYLPAVLAASTVQLLDYFVYLPIVIKQVPPTPTSTPTNTPTSTQTLIPTPTQTPTPTSAPSPMLQDGYYLAEFANGGFIQFSVKDNGTIAYGAGFLVRIASFCPWGAYTFGGSVSINNGTFQFIAVDFYNRALLARLSCGSISTTQALCSAVRFGVSTGGTCTPSASGVATKR